MTDDSTGIHRFSPTLVDLIVSVRNFLAEPAADGPAYQAKVASYLLDMAVREIRHGSELDCHSAERMTLLLGAETTSENPITTLCKAIRAGDFDTRNEQLLQVLLQETAERVAIVRPDVLEPDHRSDCDR